MIPFTEHQPNAAKSVLAKERVKLAAQLRVIDEQIAICEERLERVRARRRSVMALAAVWDRSEEILDGHRET